MAKVNGRLVGDTLVIDAADLDSVPVADDGTNAEEIEVVIDEPGVWNGAVTVFHHPRR